MARLLDRMRGCSWRLEGPVVPVGRSSGNRVVLDHPVLSRRHARLVASPGGWLVEDLGSASGTTVKARA